MPSGRFEIKLTEELTEDEEWLVGQLLADALYEFARGPREDAEAYVERKRELAPGLFRTEEDFDKKVEEVRQRTRLARKLVCGAHNCHVESGVHYTECYPAVAVDED